MRFLLVLFFLFPLMADDFLEEIILEEEEVEHCALNFTQSSAPSDAPSDTTAKSNEKAASGSARTVSSAKLEKNELQPLIFLPKLSSERPSTQSSPKLGEVMPQLMELVEEALKPLKSLELLF